MSGTDLSVWGWNLRRESGFVSHLSQISNTTVLFYLHPNDLRDICRKLLHRRTKGKTWLIINYEFIKEAKTTAAKFEKLKFRILSFCGRNTMLSLSINELFFRICWDLSSCSSFPALVKRTSHLSSRFDFFNRWKWKIKKRKNERDHCLRVNSPD